MKKYITLLLICISIFAFAQKRDITVDEIFKNFKFYQRGIDELRSTSDGNHYTDIETYDRKQAIVSFDYATGKTTDTLFTTKDITNAGLKAFRIESYTLSPGEKNILLSTASEHIYRHSSIAIYYVWNREKKTLTKLTDDNNKVMYASLSPDGNKAAYIYKGDLYTKNLTDGKTTRLTNDGSTDIFNGVSDWVYEEEFALTQAYFWSPDNKAIAFYRFDDARVPTFSMSEYKDSLYPPVNSFKYPKVGEPNATITINIYNLQDGKSVVVNPPKHYEYVPRIKWTQSSSLLSVQYMNRHQDTLVLALADVQTGKTTPILTQGETAFIDINDALTFINNNTEFIWMSDVDGFRHLYHYSIKGKLINQITKGNWEIGDFKGINEKTRTLYYIASGTSPINSEVYSIGLDGKNKKKLSTQVGSNGADFSANYGYYISSVSNLEEPGFITLNNSEGKQIRVLEDNQDLKDTLKKYDLGKKSFFTFTTSQGTNLNGWKILPPDFDSTKKYPVLMYVYGGPGANQVVNHYDGTNGMWDQLMAEKGYIMVCIDNRGTGGRGAAFKKCTYLNLGKLETEDQIEGAKYFGSLSYVDKSRIGIWGWSYGGYMAAMCITKGADYFKAATSVAPVTDWRYYDNIYTERYMRTATENPKGYEESSPIHYANELKGNYLLMQGTSDDNVHFQNSIEWIKALQKADKQFSLMIYPDKNHSILGGNIHAYLFTKLTNFWLQNL